MQRIIAAHKDVWRDRYERKGIAAERALAWNDDGESTSLHWLIKSKLAKIMWWNS